MPKSQNEKDENQAFCNWLICWLILPNLPFLPITLLGGPLRVREIFIGGLVGLIVRRFPYAIRLISFTLLSLYFILTYITSMFNMHISMLSSVAHLALELNPAVSKEYVAGFLLLILIFAVSIFHLRRPQKFQSTKALITCILLTLILSTSDLLWAQQNSTSYSRVADADMPFSSASQQVDLASLADGQTNILIIMVESMGVPTDQKMAHRLKQIWHQPAFSKHHDLSHGTTPFFNSTTKAEIRELCGRWGDYPEITSADKRCLPAQFSANGYHSTSYHGFSPSFFEREKWYPNIGFQTSLFRDELAARKAHHCVNVFPGTCDRDIPFIISQDFRARAAPQFAYWLTLNSHLPIIADPTLGTVNCQQLGASLDESYPQICRLFSLWDDIASALAREISKPDFPPTHILIVGDHMPPFTHQKSRLKFNHEVTPWIFLRYRR